MLALCHHAIVQYSYKIAYNLSLRNKTFFTKYELLGDDIVIFDQKVATVYLSIMDKLGVGINLSKSILSSNGLALEFAKRTIYKTDDVSSLP